MGGALPLLNRMPSKTAPLFFFFLLSLLLLFM